MKCRNIAFISLKVLIDIFIRYQQIYYNSNEFILDLIKEKT